MTNRKKRKPIIDRDSIKSDYCCSFIREQDDDEHVITAKEKDPQQSNLNGTELKELYESVLQEPSSSQSKQYNTKRHCKRIQESSKHKKPSNIDKHQKECDSSMLSINTRSCSNRIKAEECQEIAIDEKVSNDFHSSWRLTTKLLTLSSQGNFKGLQSFTKSISNRNDYMEVLNSADQYGWTSLMCASAGGHLKVVKHLITEGCLYKNVVENTGRDVFQICKQKREYEILEYLVNYENVDSNDGKKRTKELNAGSVGQEGIITEELIKCEVCGVDYPKTKHKVHIASMIHLFKDDTKVLGVSYEIPDHNKGFQMMLRSGWDLNRGLGPEGSGRKDPVKTILKQDRLGFGVESDSKKRINHFSAFDHDAVKPAPKKTVQQKKLAKRTYERKMIKEKAWERKMRHYMSSDF